MGKLRTFIQLCSAALCNGYVEGFVTGRLYRGPLKYICVPGLNCYSCPGALGSCPLGSLQAVLAAPAFNFSCYVVGFLLLWGSLLGRFVCGFLCPFGLLQDLFYKIPWRHKGGALPGDKYWRYAKYLILCSMVILLPILFTNPVGTGDPWFCKYLCPAGTIGGGWLQLAINEGLRSVVGKLFYWKTALAFFIIGLSIRYYRPFCRYFCPLGALYGACNKFAFYRYELVADKCVKCGACTKACPLGIDVLHNPNSAECIRCGRCKEACPTGALHRV